MLWFGLHMFLALILIVTLIVSLRKCNYFRLENKNLKKDVSNRLSSIRDLQKEVSSRNERIEELEGAIEKNYSVRVRQKVTCVCCDFTKEELGLFADGLIRLVEDRQFSYEKKKSLMSIIEKCRSVIQIMINEKPDEKLETEFIHKQLGGDNEGSKSS